MSATAKTIEHETGTALAESKSTAMTPMDLMARAVEKGLDADQLEKFLTLQERYEANLARKSFANALASLQAELPVIRKNKKGDKATYAPLEQIVRTIQPFLDEHGFSLRYDTELSINDKTGGPGVMTATCYLTHRDGHMEKNQFATPVDVGPSNAQGKRVMNTPQAVASARSYCKRYALGDALNLVFEDEDDDGKGAGTALISDNQVAVIRDYLESLEIDEAKFLQYLDVPSVEEIPGHKFNAAMTAIKRKEKAQK